MHTPCSHDTAFKLAGDFGEYQPKYSGLDNLSVVVPKRPNYPQRKLFVPLQGLQERHILAIPNVCQMLLTIWMRNKLESRDNGMAYDNRCIYHDIRRFAFFKFNVGNLIV